MGGWSPRNIWRFDSLKNLLRSLTSFPANWPVQKNVLNSVYRKLESQGASVVIFSLRFPQDSFDNCRNSFGFPDPFICKVNCNCLPYYRSLSLCLHLWLFFLVNTDTFSHKNVLLCVEKVVLYQLTSFPQTLII